jgi:hypothetical protein
MPLDGSNREPPGYPLTHWPFRSGYFVSSHACAALTVAPSAAANARAANEIRSTWLSSGSHMFRPANHSLYHPRGRTASTPRWCPATCPDSQPGDETLLRPGARVFAVVALQCDRRPRRSWRRASSRRGNIAAPARPCRFARRGFRPCRSWPDGESAAHRRSEGRNPPDFRITALCAIVRTAPTHSVANRGAGHGSDSADYLAAAIGGAG